MKPATGARRVAALERRGELVGQKLGVYQLESLLGSGGMAEVYLARDPTLARAVAVKVLPASLAADASYVTRFRTEARRVAALSHPHIVPVYAFGEQRGLLYLVMPVLRESLRDRLDRDRKLPPPEAVALALQVASALEAAHALGLVHRDVKPENILIDADKQALLTDFGIAREVNFLHRGTGAQTLSATGLPVGTPEYMAPEQLRGGGVDQRADIYALGAVLYELLTGAVPHAADSPYEVAALVLTTPLVPPAKRNPAIWPALDQAVRMALARDPDRRFSSAESFAAALRQALDVRAAQEDAAIAGRPLGTRPPVLLDEEAIETTPMAIVNPPEAGGTRTTLRLRLQEEALDASSITVAGESVPLPWSEQSGAIRVPPRRRHRWLILVAAVGVLSIALWSVTAIGALNQGGFPGSSLLAGAQSTDGSRTASSAAAATSIAAYPGAGATDSANPISSATAAPGSTATSGATTTPASSPVATATAAPTNTAQPTATPLPTMLSVTPVTIYMQGYRRSCYGSQTITNGSSVTIGWQWTSPLPLGFTYWLNGVTPPPANEPQDMSPGLSPGTTDDLRIKSTNCAFAPLTFQMVDSLGRQYATITIISPNQGGRAAGA